MGQGVTTLTVIVAFIDSDWIWHIVLCCALFLKMSACICDIIFRKARALVVMEVMLPALSENSEAKLSQSFLCSKVVLTFPVLGCTKCLQDISDAWF